MALASSQFTNIRRRGLAPGVYVVTGTFTGPASYTSGGEDFTNALVKASLGIQNIQQLVFTRLVDDDNSSLAVGCEFDHARTTSSQGKIRFIAATRPHTHDFLVKGGTAAAGTDAINIKATVIGKEAATDATNTGTTNGGVQNNTQQTSQLEVSAGAALNGYVARFICYGS